MSKHDKHDGQPKVAKHFLRMKERFPEFIAAVETLGQAVKTVGPLDVKTLQLVQLGAAAAMRSEGATISHANRALQAGATLDEVRHAVMGLTSTIGFPQVAAALSWIEHELDKKKDD